jgi:hypothetical protein
MNPFGNTFTVGGYIARPQVVPGPVRHALESRIEVRRR